MRIIWAVLLNLVLFSLATLTANAAETLSADTNASNNSTFVLGQTVSITFTISGGPHSQQESFSATVKNENGTVLATLPVVINTNSNGRGSATVTAPSANLGYYQVSATLTDGSGVTISRLATRPAGFITYAIVPDPTTRMDYGDASSRFGMQGGFSTAQGSVIPYLGIRYVMSSAGGWTALEPDSSGEFLTNRNAALANGQTYPTKNPATDSVTYNGASWRTYSVATISTATIPNWAGPVSGTAGTQNANFGALNSTGLTGITSFASAYAAEVAADYPNQSSHYYQVTWEPEYNWDYGGTPAQLVQYYQQVYAAIHNADPKALVAGPTLFPGDTDVGQLAALWSAGLANYLDAQSMHPYASYPPETTTYVSDLRTQMAQTTTAMGHSIPFIGTEHGLSSGNISTLQQAQGDIRSTIILLGEGFKFDLMFYIADFWNTSVTDTTELYGIYYNLNSAIEFGTNKIGPKPAAPAYAAMTYLLDGTTTQGPISGLTGTQMGYRFQQNSGNTVLALWDYGSSSSTATISTPVGNAKIYDWMGNLTNTVNSTGSVSVTLTNSPIYLVSGSSVKINDTDSGIVYSTNDWSYSSGRGYGDYDNDVHYCGNNGASFSYTFTGTGVALITEMYSDEGHINVQIDGGTATQVQCYNATRLAQQIVYNNINLPNGTHTITVTKVDGTFMLLDAIMVYQANPDPASPSITSANSTTFTIGEPGAFTVTATGAPTATFNVTDLPAWASFNSTTGVLSGTPPNNSGAPYTLTLTATNGTAPDATQTFTLNIQTAFDQWATSYGVSGTASTPQYDGVPNLLKYLYDINPTIPMATADYAALPSQGMDTTTLPGTPCLTLTYRQNPLESGITVNVQTSSDLKTWTTASPPDINQQIGIDGTTGDPIMKVGVRTTGSRQFIRLNVTLP